MPYIFIYIYAIEVVIGSFTKTPRSSQGKAAPVAAPAVQSEDLAAALLLFTEILRDSAADLRQSGPHHFAEITLRRRKMVNSSSLGEKQRGLKHT